MNRFKRKSNLRTYGLVSLCAALLLGAEAVIAADGFSVDETSSGVTVKYNGELVTNYIIDEANKPYMYPLVGPTGKLMTRAYPMKTVEGEHHDHPHHRSIWFGHQRVGGFDTWHEPMSAADKKLKGDRLKAFKEGLGSTVHRDFKRVLASVKRAVIETRNDYIGGTGKKLMSDERVVTFRMMRGQLVIDFDITFIASYGDIEIGDMKDAGLSVRIPSSMSLKSELGGEIVNSEGVRDGDTWSKRAAWVDYHGPVDGEHLGIAILNHPDSFRYPTPWHVRTYGLFTANPFGFKSLDETLDDASFTLVDGTRFLLRHRLIFHEGDEKDAKIAQAFKAYSKR
jgi:hypothetical protein|tara:strand:+ start:6739 stop:7755 length:1017 start_codon:yes stop_codon:yes gene_type:complete